ncbi:hypothetical protein ACOCJ7_00880 [Knoellia sp. CPCC 206453]|uniref:hypothetical protein n=1 Tax=Knoellia pratensis TaxID=3404796 RepID=UPI00360E240D
MNATPLFQMSWTRNQRLLGVGFAAVGLAIAAGRIGRGLVALRWGAAFGVVGAVALMALTFVFALFLGAVVDLTSGITGQDLGELDRGALARAAAFGPLTCIAVSSGLA